MFGSSKWTSSAGLAAIATGAGNLLTMWGTKSFDMNLALASVNGIFAGLGLVFAKDKNVTGGTVSAATGNEVKDTSPDVAGRLSQR